MSPNTLLSRAELPRAAHGCHRSREVKESCECALPTVSEAHRGLGAMGNAMRAAERGEIIRRRVVHEAAIFGAHENVLREVEIGATAIDERGARLGVDAHEILRIKNQTAGSREYERRELMHRHTKHIRGRDFMGIALHPEHAIGRAVVLCVERISMVGFHAVMSVEEVAIAAENATAIGGSVLDA